AASEKRVCGWMGLFKGLHQRSVYAVGWACSRGCIGEACMRLEGPVQGAASEKRVCGWKGLFKGLHRRSVYAVGRACSRGCIREACMRLEGPVQGAASEKRVCGWMGLFRDGPPRAKGGWCDNYISRGVCQ